MDDAGTSLEDALIEIRHCVVILNKAEIECDRVVSVRKRSPVIHHKAKTPYVHLDASVKAAKQKLGKSREAFKKAAKHALMPSVFAQTYYENKQILNVYSTLQNLLDNVLSITATGDAAKDLKVRAALTHAKYELVTLKDMLDKLSIIFNKTVCMKKNTLQVFIEVFETAAVTLEKGSKSLAVTLSNHSMEEPRKAEIIVFLQALESVNQCLNKGKAAIVTIALLLNERGYPALSKKVQELSQIINKCLLNAGSLITSLEGSSDLNEFQMTAIIQLKTDVNHIRVYGIEFLRGNVMDKICERADKK